MTSDDKVGGLKKVKIMMTQSGLDAILEWSLERVNTLFDCTESIK